MRQHGARLGAGWGRRLDLHEPWARSRPIENVDDRNVFVTVTNLELRSKYTEPPKQRMEVTHRQGRAIVVITEPSGFDGGPVMASEVDIDQVSRPTRKGLANFVLAIWFAARELKAAIKASRRVAAFQ